MGPTISFKGLGNDAYYLLHPTQPQYYMDYSGCGNTVNANHPIVQKFILDCLHYWVEEMHVDGFRFDEGSVLHRGGDGAPMEFPPVVWGIELSEKLADTKMIAEAWDAGGLYDVGQFPGSRWSDWNGRFRDDVRRFVRGDLGLVSTIATRISGSMDMYEGGGRSPANSVNFITAHDGFTLYDLVAYNEKHNEANGEGNRDGIDDNLSWNCGVEGPTDDPDVNALRERQLKNFAAVLFALAGRADVRRRRRGRPHAARQQQRLLPGQRALAGSTGRCVEENADLFRFFKQHDRAPAPAREPAPPLVPHRRPQPARRRRTSAGTASSSTSAEWGNPVSRVLAFTLAGDEPLEPDLHVMMNMDDAPHDFAVPHERRPPLARVRRHREGRHPTTSPSPARSSRSRASAARSRAAAS